MGAWAAFGDNEEVVVLDSLGVVHRIRNEAEVDPYVLHDAFRGRCKDLFRDNTYREENDRHCDC